MRRNEVKRIALGGMLAAVAVVIMCLGGFIPVATYICPMLCCLTQFLVYRFCGKRIAWTWYVAVSVLVLILCPDKEAAMVFLALGYYPLIKPLIDRNKFRAILKFLFFNSSILIVYGVLIYLMGMEDIASENMEFGMIGLGIILLMGNVTFFLLDKLLMILSGKLR